MPNVVYHPDKIHIFLVVDSKQALEEYMADII